MSFSYSRENKLKQKKEIALLFEKGQWKTAGNIRLIILNVENLQPKLGVSVSKRNFKKAVDRNRIKRLLREVYRLNKNDFEEVFGKNYIAMMFWHSKKMPASYQEVLVEFEKLSYAKSNS